MASVRKGFGHGLLLSPVSPALQWTIGWPSARLTHIDREGRVWMVDVSAKPVSGCTATAVGFVTVRAEIGGALAEAFGPKGEVRAAAELAGAMAAKRTADLIPPRHPLALTAIVVEVKPCAGGVRAEARVRGHGQAGVEMEALTAVSLACLTVYDRLKAIGHDMVIEGIQLLSSTGGASGDVNRVTI